MPQSPQQPTAPQNPCHRRGRCRPRRCRPRPRPRRREPLVAQIQALVEEAKTAAREAADHARRAADAADTAAREAGNARYAANFAGQHAQTAAEAAQRSRSNVELAKKTHEIATVSTDQRFNDERSFLKDQALAAREVQDAKDNAAEEEKKRRTELSGEMEQLLSKLPNNADEFNPSKESIADIRRLALAAAQVGTPAVAGAAKVALEGNTSDDLIDFAFQGYPDAKEDDNLSLVSYWALHDPDEELRNAADEVGYEDAETIEHFVNGGGYDKARYSDQLQQAYNLVETGGKEVAIAAEAALTGDRSGLDEFITIEQYRRGMYDYQRDAHNAEIVSLLELGNRAADDASQQAASAQAAYQQANGAADRADEYAREARQWAGRAQQSAQQAQAHVDSAQQSLVFAQQQQQRAHEAAASAEADAAQASNNADQATTYAATARAAATNAAASASAARQSANAASHDAAAASQAANDAYAAAWQLELSEMEQARAAAAEGELKIEPQSALDKIRSAIGTDTLDLILDIIGVGDVLKCFRGDFSGCIWAAVGVFPIGKAAKIAKAIPAIRKLIAKTGEIKRAFQYSRVKAALDDALIPAACRIGGVAATGAVTYSNAIYRTPAAAQNTYITATSKCPIPSTVKKINGRYPINARFAGGIWRHNDPAKIPAEIVQKYPEGVRFNERGFPEFTQYRHPYNPREMKGDATDTDLRIKPTGNSNDDMKIADNKLGIDETYRKKNGLVWHHHEDCGRMQLIPQDLHQIVRHTGGVAAWPEIPGCL